jgi:tetratricopeptide (TPR) repeat protein
LGNFELAKSYLEMAWSKEPLAEIAAHLADVYYQLGDRDTAFDYLQQGYELDPLDSALLSTSERLGYQPKVKDSPAESVDESQSKEVE